MAYDLLNMNPEKPMACGVSLLGDDAAGPHLNFIQISDYPWRFYFRLQRKKCQKKQVEASLHKFC